MTRSRPITIFVSPVQRALIDATIRDLRRREAERRLRERRAA